MLKYKDSLFIKYIYKIYTNISNIIYNQIQYIYNNINKDIVNISLYIKNNIINNININNIINYIKLLEIKICIYINAL